MTYANMTYWQPYMAVKNIIVLTLDMTIVVSPLLITTYNNFILFVILSCLARSLLCYKCTNTFIKLTGDMIYGKRTHTRWVLLGSTQR